MIPAEESVGTDLSVALRIEQIAHETSIGKNFLVFLPEHVHLFQVFAVSGSLCNGCPAAVDLHIGKTARQSRFIQQTDVIAIVIADIPVGNTDLREGVTEEFQKGIGSSAVILFERTLSQDDPAAGTSVELKHGA